MHITFWLEAAVLVTPWWAWAAGLVTLAASAAAIWRL